MDTDRPRRQRVLAIFVHSNVNFGNVKTFSSTDTDNEAITYILKYSQKSKCISIIYIPPASLVNITLLNNIKNFADNVNINITGNLNVKYTDFN